jgi:hypothetical protein
MCFWWLIFVKKNKSLNACDELLNECSPYKDQDSGVLVILGQKFVSFIFYIFQVFLSDVWMLCETLVIQPTYVIVRIQF